MRFHLVSLFASFALLASPIVAHADDRPAPVDVAPAPPRVWYGWQPLIADAAAAGLFVGGLATERYEVADLGLAGFALASPIIHGAHRHGVKAVGALALRVALPITGALVGLD